MNRKRGTMQKQEIKHWYLRGYHNYVPLHEKSRETDAQTKGVTVDMAVTTPHSIYDALLQYGYIEDPYFDMNSVKCEWVANRWWVYYTTIEIGESAEYTELVFDGLDYRAHIYVNDEKIGFAENAFIRHTYDVTDCIHPGTNTVKVILEHAPDEMGQIGFSDRVITQKPKFNYKWDFCTRMVSLGIYKPVYLRFGSKTRIENVHFFQGKSTNEASVAVTCENFTKDCRVIAEFDGMRYEATDISAPIHFCIEVPHLWYPNGMGDSCLYQLKVKLVRGSECLDTYETKVGLRSLSLEQNTNAENALPYVFVVNGKKVYIKGVNITPLDQTCYTPNERYDQLLLLLKKANVNFIRVWGGGMIESEYFYRRCDELGFMVLQDFTQSSCGINNETCKAPEYLENLAQTAVFACKELRNHPSLVAFDGGNEMISSEWMPLTEDDMNIGKLGAIVREHCNDRFFFPTTPSGLSVNGDLGRRGINHDIHGPWKYYQNHYSFYNIIDSLLHSEFGVDGMSCVESLKKFLSPENLRVSNTVENLVWRHHGEWWDTYSRDCEIFGVPETLEEQVCRSQRVQAEGLRYALEANRRRAFENSGSIIWQANECYPNVSSTALIDFYMQPKPVLEQVGKAYAPLNVSLKYDAWVLHPGQILDLEVYAISDREPLSTAIWVTIRNGNEMQTFSYQTTLQDSVAVCLDKLSVQVKDSLQVVLYAENTIDAFENDIVFIVKNDIKNRNMGQ